jgi:hypothetical protein
VTKKLNKAVFRKKNKICIASTRLRNDQYGAFLVEYKGKSAVFALEIKVKKVCFFGLTPAQALQKLLEPVSGKRP